MKFVIALAGALLAGGNAANATVMDCAELTLASLSLTGSFQTTVPPTGPQIIASKIEGPKDPDVPPDPPPAPDGK